LIKLCSTSSRNWRPSSSSRRARCNCFNDINYENFCLPSSLGSVPPTAAADETLESVLGDVVILYKVAQRTSSYLSRYPTLFLRSSQPDRYTSSAFFVIDDNLAFEN
jgi:hypothetical protein